MKRILFFLLVIVLLCSLPLQTFAATTGDCSMEVIMEYQGKKITGGELIAVRVGYPDFDTGSFRQMTDSAEIENIGKPGAVNEMLKYYGDAKKNYTFDVYTAEVKDGKALFNEIPMGLYLIFQQKAASGYNNISPFLVTVPYDGKMDVTSISKPEMKKEPPSPTETTKPTTGGSSGGNTGNKLPQTGQLTWPIPWLASSGMVLFVLGWWLCFGRRKDSYEN